MRTTLHPIAPEVMALMDGELAGAEAEAVSRHLENCAECAEVAERLRGASKEFQTWTVGTVPKKVEESIRERIGELQGGKNIGKGNIFVRASFWSWKRWSMGIAGMVAAVLVLLAGTSAMRDRMPMNSAHTEAQARAVAGDNATIRGQRSAQQPEKKKEPANAQGWQFSPNAPQAPLKIMQSSTGSAVVANDTETSPTGLPAAGRTIGSLLSLQAPMIERTVALTIVTKNFAGSRTALDGIVTRRHGYAAQMNVSTAEDTARSLQASLRIPVGDLGAAILELKTLGRVENESQTGEEVTQQHADLVARLKNSRETEQRLQAILTQRTGKISDVLEVEQEVARVRGDIEGMEAQQRNLEHLVEFATVNLQLREEYKAQLNPPAPSISTRVHNSMVAGYRNASETILGFVLFFAESGPTLLIWLVILLVPGWFFWRRYKRAVAAA